MSDRARTNAAAAAKETEMPSEAPPLDEAALVRALLARDGRVATEALRHFQPMAARFLRRFFGPSPVRKEDLEDLCQEVFMRFFTRIDELRDPAAVRGFLISICLGFARNERR